MWQEEKVPAVSEQLDLASIAVEPSYTGPRMDGDFLISYASS